MELRTLRINSFGTFSTNDTNDQEFAAFPVIAVMSYWGRKGCALLTFGYGARSVVMDCLVVFAEFHGFKAGHMGDEITEQCFYVDFEFGFGISEERVASF